MSKTSIPIPKNYILTQTPCPVLRYTSDKKKKAEIEKMSQQPKFTSPPPEVRDSIVEFPEKGIMVVTLKYVDILFHFPYSSFPPTRRKELEREPYTILVYDGTGLTACACSFHVLCGV